VPSRFNLETFNNSGIPLEKLRVVPGGVDVGCFHPGAPPLKPVAQGGFTFFSMFNIGCRKGWDILLTAYCTEFKPQEDVTLLIKTARQGTPGSLYEQFGCFLNQLARQQAIPRLRIIDSYLPGASLPGLYTACDAFVLPSRGEAWGRSYSEAMACGLPTIGTKWGGNLEYMNAENSYLLEIEGLEDVPCIPDDPENGYYLGHQWAKPSVEHLRHLMRHVFEHRQEAKERGARARRDICEKWTWGQAASAAARELLKYSR
jgi:glycosyltransferase involved in cell wall biosynthesis